MTDFYAPIWGQQRQLSRRQSPERVADLLAAAIAILEQKPGFPDTTRLRTFALNAKKLE